MHTLRWILYRRVHVCVTERYNGIFPFHCRWSSSSRWLTKNFKSVNVYCVRAWTGTSKATVCEIKCIWTDYALCIFGCFPAFRDENTLMLLMLMFNIPIFANSPKFNSSKFILGLKSEFSLFFFFGWSFNCYSMLLYHRQHHPFTFKTQNLTEKEKNIEFRVPFNYTKSRYGLW